MSFQFIPTGMRAPKKAPHSKLPSLEDKLQRAPHEYSLPSAKLVSTNETFHGASLGKAVSLEFLPSHACARGVLSSGAEVSATVKFAVQFHKIPTCKARTEAGRTKTVKRVNTAEGQESGLRDEDCVSQATPMSKMWKNIFAISPFGAEFGSVW